MGKKNKGQQHQQNPPGKKQRPGSKASSTTCSYIQVLSPGQDVYGGLAPASVLLFFDKRRYLFNCGEGFQRLCVEQKVRMTRIDHLFFTRATTDASGGLPGYLLTRDDSGAVPPEMSLFGPPPLYGMLTAIRNFCNIHFKIKPKQFSPKVEGPFGVSNDHLDVQPSKRIYADEHVTVRAFVVEARPSKMKGEFSSSLERGDVEESEPVRAASETERVDPPKRRKLLPSSGLPIVASGDESRKNIHYGPIVCYALELPEVPGKFNAEKAEALRVPHDKRRAQLIRGEAITTDDGRTIRPEDVVADSIPGPVVLLLDCPSEAYLENLTSDAELQDYLNPSEAGDGENSAGREIACVVHLAAANILRHPEYLNWLRAFPAGATHIAPAGFSKDVAPGFLSASRINARLNCINEQVFPLQFANSGESLPEVYMNGDNAIKFQLRPIASLGVDSSAVAHKVDTQAVRQEVLDSFAQQPLVSGIPASPHANQVLAMDKDTTLDLPECLRSVRRDEMEFVFLGTGAAQPSKYRNVTSMYTHCFDKGGFLLDAGEDTCGQLFRRFGQQSEDVLKNLRLVWISHIHADHHAGLFPLLRRRRALLGPGCPPLTVVGPRPLARVIQAYDRLEPLSAKFIDCSEFRSDRPPGSPGQRALLDTVLDRLDLTKLECVPVLHCPHAYGLVFEHKKGWKIAISGDTRPCPKLIEAAQGATLLVHEATFEDSLLDEAIAKRHSITREAVESGVACGAYRVLLTHFSQRYPKIPVFDDSYTDRTAIAFDLMSVNVADLHFLPGLLPSLKFLFRDEMMAEEGASGQFEEVGA